MTQVKQFSIRDYVASARRLGMNIRIAATLLIIEFGAIAFEFGGVAVLVPVFQFMQTGGDLSALGAQHEYWAGIIKAHTFLGVEVSLGSLLVTSFALLLARQGTIYIRFVYRVSVRQRLAHRLRDDGFGTFMAADYGYQRDASKGTLIADFTVELPRAVNAVFDSILVLGHVGLIAVYAAGLFYLSSEMTLITLAVLCISGLALRGILRRTEATSGEISGTNRRFGAFLSERIAATRLIRLSNSADEERDKLYGLSDRLANRTIRLSKLQALPQLIIEPTAALIAFAIIYIGYTRFAMTPDTLAVFAIALARLLPVIRSTISDVQTVLGQWASLRVIVERFDEIAERREQPGEGKQFPGLTEAIRFEKVCYTYPGRDIPALHDVSFEVPKGALWTIVGRSGAGKSTLVDLLPRLISPTSGRILFDGVPIETFETESVRRAIAFVGQQAEVFDGTIRDHITYGVADASDTAIARAAEIAGATEFIAALPDGYDTQIGERASSLSGGQRQRLDIARAILRGASILIMDEPTSALDRAASMHLAETLRSLCAQTGTTVLVISHGMELTNEADCVLVLRNGRVVACAPAEELNLHEASLNAPTLKSQPA